MPRIPTLGVLLLVAAGWTWFVWLTRIGNLVADDRSATFVAVHIGLAAVSVILAIPVAWVGLRLFRGAPGRG